MKNLELELKEVQAQVFKLTRKSNKSEKDYSKLEALHKKENEIAIKLFND